MTITRSNPEIHIDLSLTTLQAFCQLMLQISLIAIPVYLALFMLAIPFDSNAGVKRGLVLFLPVVEFSLSAGLYALGFLTVSPSPSQTEFAPLERLNRPTIRRKRLLISLGSVSFFLGILSGSLILIKAHL